MCWRPTARRRSSSAGTWPSGSSTWPWGNDVTRHAHRVLAVTEAERRQLQRPGRGRRPHPAGPQPDRSRGVRRRRRRRGLQRAARADRPAGGVPRQDHAAQARRRADSRLRAAATPRRHARHRRQRHGRRGVGARHRRGHGRGGSHAVRRACCRAPERLELLADADVVVYPSEHEIFGLVPLEALLVGTPVVVADDSGCGEVVRQRRRRAGGARTRRRAGRGPSTRCWDSPSAGARAATRRRTQVRARFGAETVGAQLEELYGEVMRTH